MKWVGVVALVFLSKVLVMMKGNDFWVYGVLLSGSKFIQKLDVTVEGMV